MEINQETEGVKPSSGGLSKLVDYGEDSGDESPLDSTTTVPVPSEGAQLIIPEVKTIEDVAMEGTTPGSGINGTAIVTKVVVEESIPSTTALEINGNSDSKVVVGYELKSHGETEQGMEGVFTVAVSEGVGKQIVKEASDGSTGGVSAEMREDPPAVPALNGGVYRERRVSTSSCSSSSSEESVELTIDSSDSDSDDSSDTEKGQAAEKAANELARKKKIKPIPKVKGELGLEDLEPIVDLKISVPENKVEPIGKVASVVGCLVTIDGFEKKPALDLGTVLFLEEGHKAMGHIFEVYGRTTQANYAVRFNSPEHVKERGVEIGMTVYAAPGTEHTRYVFLAQLERLRGTDASWKDDHETPGEFVDYSDDEMEKTARNKNRKPRPKKNPPLNRSLPPDTEVPPEFMEGNRMARKRNFGNTNGFPAPPNRFGQPGPGFMPSNGFHGFPPRGYAPGPFRPTFGQNCFRPMMPYQEHYGPPCGRIDAYGGYPYGAPPTPPNPFSVGGAAVPYRHPFENNHAHAWMNYPPSPVPNYWQPQPQPPVAPVHCSPYDYQAQWNAYQYQQQQNYAAAAAPPAPQTAAPVQTAAAPPAPAVLPTPPPYISKEPVLNKEILAKIQAERLKQRLEMSA